MIKSIFTSLMLSKQRGMFQSQQKIPDPKAKKVKPSSVYDNILITDDPASAKQFVEEMFANSKEAQRAREEGERRRKERGYERRSCDKERHRDRYKTRDRRDYMDDYHNEI